MKTNLLKPDDVLDQISYLKELADQSRIKIAYGYPYFFLWGFIWLVAYLSSIIIPHKQLGMMWLTMSSIGILATALICYRMGRQTGPFPALLKKLGWLSLLMWVVAVMLFPLTFRSGYNLNLINAYWPFQIGVIYLANSIFFDRQLAMIGCWLIFAAFISLIIPIPYFFIWLALAGGGGLLFTGYIFRKQVVKVG